jgi:pimeloyl-ACP methyl ester carboxylesterase
MNSGTAIVEMHPRCFVLIRGLARERGHWGSFVTGLERCFPDLPIHAIDLPGTGNKRHLRSPASIAAIAGVIHGEIAGLSRPLVIGMSLGAMVALELARQMDSQISGAVCINTSAGDLSPLGQRLSLSGIALVCASLLGAPPRTRERWIHRITSNHALATCPDLERWIAIANHHPVSRKVALAHVLAAAHYRVRKGPKIRVPLLWLTSRGDRLVDWRCTLQLQRELGGAIGIHDIAGHDLPHDAESWGIEQIRDWLVTSSRETSS